MPSHRREYGAGTALQLHTLLPFAVATKTSPSCSRLARRSAAAAASVAVAPPPPLPPHQRTTMALLYPQQQQQINNCHDIISASMESACFQVSQYATHHSSLQQGTHDQSLLQQQDRHHEQTQQSSARGGSGIGAYAAADRNCRLSAAASGAGLDLLQHVEPQQQQRLASSSSENSRSRNLSGVVMAGASTTTEQMDMDMDALDMSLQLQLGDFQEWWPPIAASEEVVSSNNNNHHQHALPLLSNNNSNIIPQQQQQQQQQHQRDREEREKTQNNSSSAVFVAAAAEAINKEQQQEETRFDLESWCAARSSIAGVQNLLNIDDNNNDNSNALPKATCNNKRSHVLSSSSRDQSCGGHNIAAAGATMVEQMTPTIERGGSRGGSHQQHKGARGRISSPCAAVTYPREGEKAANLTPPVVAAATAVHHKKPWGGSSSGCVKRAVSQRESHIWSERQRRKGMNHLFSTLRSLLPQPSSKTDKSTVVSEIIKYIQSLQLKLDILVKKRQQMLEARALSQTVVPTEQQQQQADLAAMSANLNHPLQQQEIIQQTDSCLQSFLGANVGLHICGSNAFITISSPRGQRGIFHRILVTVQNQHLDVINAFISTSKASIFHCLHCQALQGSDLSKEELHTALQMVITNYGQSI
ncbi:hypothetical protein CY35_16G057800 [Sphagnum magellanicum]|nr:hypothetical protein CY35_16G057800 [Sphagnum magellanicum]